MVGRRAELAADRTEATVRKAHLSLLRGRGRLDLSKLLSLSWSITALIVWNHTYRLAGVEEISGLVPGMGCLTGTGFSLKEPAQDLALALHAAAELPLPSD